MASMDPILNKSYPSPKTGNTVVVFPDGSHEERQSTARLSGVLNEYEVEMINSGVWKVEGVLLEDSQIKAVDPERISWRNGIAHVPLSSGAWLAQTGLIVFTEA